MWKSRAKNYTKLAELIFLQVKLQKEFVKVDVLKQKTNISILPPPIRYRPKGIPTEKKRNLLTHLCQYMPVLRRQLWLIAEEFEDVEDLFTNY